MTNPLYNKDGAAVPKRPEYSDELIIKGDVTIPPRPVLTHQTLKTAIANGAKGCESFGHLSLSEVEQFALDFCIVWEYGKDEYVMAKELESKGYVVNLQFVNDLAKFPAHIDEAQHDSEMLWATKYKSELLLLVGSTFDMEFDGKMHNITIDTFLNRSPAQYGVILDNLPDDEKRRIISLEEALEALNNSNKPSDK
ncbi:hypothetical protein OTK49_03195 [Vibrio coralliirubri]|uniref:hypothetical protein n=1 Tax=Vibrio coralliirubri TaxID=1516159 RepID=UPI002284E18D|nr:hypothetical protein [Vibrio coralliirubri]MCY9861522.1 hypothetical protein [Vibrio coralliirubri]